MRRDEENYVLFFFADALCTRSCRPIKPPRTFNRRTPCVLQLKPDAPALQRVYPPIFNIRNFVLDLIPDHVC